MSIFTGYLIIGVLFVLCFVIVILLLTSNFAKKHFSNTTRNCLLYCFFAVNIFFCIQHGYISVQLQEIEEEFIQVAHSKYRTTDMRFEGDGYIYYILDYEGAIDEIIAKRNDFLKKHHYKILGSWNISTHPNNETEVSMNAIYVWIPFI